MCEVPRTWMQNKSHFYDRYYQKSRSDEVEIQVQYRKFIQKRLVVIHPELLKILCYNFDDIIPKYRCEFVVVMLISFLKDNNDTESMCAVRLFHFSANFFDHK